MCAVIRHIAVVHHVVFVTVDVLVATAANVIDLLDGGRTALFVALQVPSILMHAVIDDAVGDGGVDSLCRIVADGVCDAVRHCAASGAVVGVRASTTLLLRVATAILHVEEVGDVAVHAKVNLLHTSQHGVVVKI